ncbi:TrmH family RNA methyltransferase [Hymenobacter sp. BRD67]|uniref:TrmH family RNA methyltransferase n=1 Tax=Hymenobacter sp. BRD67 TaxID=2675877 RepID=UPI0015634512|nr:RNA methyltransferase [Hymenobacter sp. BRD67]QKG53412.1 RNA methyltransferase [Hymenobacter sp. BRD67]
MYAARPSSPDRITSLHNPRIKDVLRLQEKSAERRRQGLTLVEGYRELTNARQAGWAVATLFVCAELAGDELNQELLAPAQLVPRSYEFLPVSAAVFAKLAVRERSDGVLAVLRTPQYTLASLSLPPNPLVLVLEAVEKPGNLGAILRTADAAPAHAVLVGDPRTDLYNPNVIRASLGGIFTVPTVAAPMAEVLAFLKEKGIRTFAAALADGAKAYTDASFTGPTALVLGTEADGLTPATRAACDETVIIPMRGVLDSLNVSVAAAVLTFEAVRQRG